MNGIEAMWRNLRSGCSLKFIERIVPVELSLIQQSEKSCGLSKYQFSCTMSYATSTRPRGLTNS